MESMDHGSHKETLCFCMEMQASMGSTFELNSVNGVFTYMNVNKCVKKILNEILISSFHPKCAVIILPVLFIDREAGR